MEKLSESLQESLLTLLCYDEKSAKIIRNIASVSHFDSFYSPIVSKIYSYIDQYDSVPKDNTIDLFDDVIYGDNEEKARVYKELFIAVAENSSSIFAKYHLDRLSEFIERQELKKAIIKAAPLLQSETREGLESAKAVISSSLNKKLEIFDAGIRLGDVRNLDKENEPEFVTGIRELDKHSVCPDRGQLMTLIAKYNAGKTWWLINIGKRALMNRKKVCHISLEMSDKMIATRYYQCLFAVSTRKEALVISNFVKDSDNRLIGIDENDIQAKMSFESPTDVIKLKQKIQMWGPRLNSLVIKQFPTSSLSVHNLEAYLDALEDREGFFPDILLIDYADLMKLDTSSYRLELGRIYRELRGIAVKRNIAVVTVSQSNRQSEKSKIITGAEVAEDFSKMATADVVLSYNQTEAEQKSGLARLFVIKNRSDKGKYVVLISQNYSIGQFVIDSCMMSDHYWDLIE